jgi:CBS domain-containing membrane protein
MLMADARGWLARFKPVRTPLPGWERVAAWIGALIGLLFTGAVSRAWLGSNELVPLLIAPIGASTVLVFGVPASPLAQPWSVVGGNFLAALIGVTAARFIPIPLCAAAVAVATTISVTSLLGCLHPPAGAVALTAVIGGPVIAAAGYRFAVVPVALNSVLLVGAGVVFNNLARRPYPHVAPMPVSAHRTADAPAEFRLGFSAADIDAAVERLGTPLEVQRDDLYALFRLVEEDAHRRRHAPIRCGEIMSRDLVTVQPTDSAEHAFELLREHALRALPVVEAASGRVLKVVDAATLASQRGALVAALPSVDFELVHVDQLAHELASKLAHGPAHEAMVVDSDSRLVGIVTQGDLLAILGRARLTRPVSGKRLDWAGGKSSLASGTGRRGLVDLGGRTRGAE